MDQIQNYNVIFRPEPDGGYTAIVPSLPGCVTFGETLESAKAMVADAIEGYIASLRKHDEPIPNDNNSFITSVAVSNAHAYA